MLVYLTILFSYLRNIFSRRSKFYVSIPISRFSNLIFCTIVKQQQHILQSNFGLFVNYNKTLIFNTKIAGVSFVRMSYKERHVFFMYLRFLGSEQVLTLSKQDLFDNLVLLLCDFFLLQTLLSSTSLTKMVK